MPDLQSWRSQGLCVGLTPKEADRIFFIGRGQSSKQAEIFCSNCSVKSNCIEFALLYKEEGIWAGTKKEDRESLSFLEGPLREREQAAGRLETRTYSYGPLAPPLQLGEHLAV